MAPPKILVTGGSGFIGGTVISRLLTPKSGTPVQPSNIIAVVRNESHIAKMGKLGITLVRADLSDANTLRQAVLEHGVQMVINCASAFDPAFALSLIEALGEHSENTGDRVFFIHTSGTSAYSTSTGWEYPVVYDTDDVYQMEKDTKQDYILRDTNPIVCDSAKEKRVTCSIVVPPFIYGIGSGLCGRFTSQTPLFIESSIESKEVCKPPERSGWPAISIDDLADFYVLLVQRIISDDPPADGFDGYYFPIAHDIDWWEVMDAFSQALYSRGLVDQPKSVPATSTEEATARLGFPVTLASILFKSKINAIPVRSKKLGWKPICDNSMYLTGIDSEVETYLQGNKGGSALSDFMDRFDKK